MHTHAQAFKRTLACTHIQARTPSQQISHFHVGSMDTAEGEEAGIAYVISASDLGSDTWPEQWIHFPKAWTFYLRNEIPIIWI